MTSKMRSFRNFRNPVGCLILLAALLAGAGCSTATPGGSLLDAGGNHPADFVSIHPGYARPDGSLCTACHGDDLKGGISKVSCFSASFNGVGCHANGPAFHPALWLDKAKKGSATDGKPDFHGTGYSSGYTINGLACSACHDLNVKCTICHFNIQGTQRVPTGSAYVHGQIAGHTGFGQLDTPNATSSVCINCHETNNRFGLMPQPFCHNCHSPKPTRFHPAGWDNAVRHGAAAKDHPGTGAGFAYCRNCHGTGFAGSGNARSCISDLACHGYSGDNASLPAAASPHPPRKWRASAGTTYTHTTTDSDNTLGASGNPAVCGACHRNRQNAGADVPAPVPPYPGDSVPPGCFNSTLCHNVVVQHGAGWISPLPGEHGTVAANDLRVCQACHASPPAGANPRFNLPKGTKLTNGCEDCHKARTAHAPVDPAKRSGWPAHWYGHDNAHLMAVTCTLCHGANLNGVGGVPNATGCAPTCHASTPVNLTTGAPITGCVSCHANVPNGPDGTQYPNIAGAHKKHIGDLNGVGNYGIACASCHNGLGSPTTSHYDRAVPPQSPPASVAFAAAFNATFAVAGNTLGFNSSLSSLSCSNVSCHGAQNTPGWRTSATCSSCHKPRGTAVNGAPATYYNDYSSGRHPDHSGVPCTDCHNMTLATAGAQNHFRFLNTDNVMEGPASQTIQLQVDSGAPSYNSSTGSCGTFVCHGESHPSSRTW